MFQNLEIIQSLIICVNNLEVLVIGYCQALIFKYLSNVVYERLYFLILIYALQACDM